MDTENEPSSTPRTTSSPSSMASRTEQKVAKQKLAAERARLLFGSYRKGEANDPDTYVMMITATLMAYDNSVICEATHPHTGIQFTEKFKTWMPQPGELKEFCEGLAARNARNAAHLAARLAPPAISPAVDRSANPTLEELCQKYPGLFRDKPPPTRQNTMRRLGELAAEWGVTVTREQIEAIPDAKKAG
jgi:hypothetical protein